MNVQPKSRLLSIGMLLICLVLLAEDGLAQKTDRVYRNETIAAELFKSLPNVRSTLDTALFKELKSSLPNMEIAGVGYYFVEGDRRINEDELYLYAAKLNKQYAVWRSLQSLPFQLRTELVGLQQQLVSEVEGGKIIRWKPDSTVSYCILKRSFGTGPSAIERYEQVASEFQMATQAWTSIPGTSVPSFQYRSELDDQSANGCSQRSYIRGLVSGVTRFSDCLRIFPKRPSGEVECVDLTPGRVLRHGIAV